MSAFMFGCTCIILFRLLQSAAMIQEHRASKLRTVLLACALYVHESIVQCQF